MFHNLTQFGKLASGEKIFKNMIIINALVIAISICSTGVVQSGPATTGRISGTLVDAETGEALIGVSVYLEGTALGAVCDLDGNYTIKKVAPGIYSLRVQMVGYSTATVSDVEVLAGEETIVSFQMAQSILELEGDLVVGRAVRNNEAILLKQRKNASSVSDGISSEQISRSGSSDAADAVKNVVGASVVDGRYVVIRGLGGRYSHTQLNGSRLPSSNPDNQAVPMDLIPANLLDNIVVNKSFTPDKPGDFAGGSTDLNTKDYPESRILVLSTSAGYNSQVTFEDGLLVHGPSSTDWLGFDNGKRDIPKIISENPDLQEQVPGSRRFLNISQPHLQDSLSLVQYIDSSSRAFNAEMAPSEREAPLNESHSLAYGDKWQLFDRPLGIVASLTYRRSFQKYSGFQGRYRRAGVESEELTPDYEFTDNRGISEILWGGLTTLRYGIHRNHKLSWSYMYNRSGQSTSRNLSGEWLEYSDPDVEVRNYVLGYAERKLSSNQFSGKHVLFGDKIRANWNVSLSNTSQSEPDLRFFTDEAEPTRIELVDENGDDYLADTVQYVIRTSRYRAPQRLWRDLEETNRDFRLDLTAPLSRRASFKTGVAYLKTDRTYTERRFQYQNTLDSHYKTFNGSVNEYVRDMGLDTVNVYYNGQDTIYQYIYTNYLAETSEDRNQYKGQTRVFALYGMLELPISSRLKFVGGARYETTDMFSETSDLSYDPGQIDEGNLLPSVNLIYGLRHDMNLRASYGRTLARPTLREMTPAVSEEFAIGSFFNGNADIKMTKIDNLDLRWEWFPRPGEVVAVGGFYKGIEDPIELAIVSVNRDIMPLNSEKAIILGMEFEFRKRLDFISHKLAKLRVGGNLTLVTSDVRIAQDEMDEILPLFPDADDTRPMAGQSPYLINLDIGYDNPRSRTSVSFFYNVFGERFAFNSEGTTPDVYEQPRQQMNLLLSQWVFDRTAFKIGVKNMLNSDSRFVYKDNLGSTDLGGKTYQEYSSGVTYSVGLSYKVW